MRYMRTHIVDNMKDIYVMGINVSNHDRSAALLKNGEIICAISEERLDRRKHSEGFYNNSHNGIILPPMASITYCLNFANICIDDITLLVCGRSITTCKDVVLKYIPIKDKSKIVEIPIPSHHLAHAYSTYFASGFNESIIFVIDEQGHWNDDKFEKISIYYAKDEKVSKIRKFFGNYFDISLGMFYDFFATIIGFSDGMLPAAGKLMGLAAYGTLKENDFYLIDLEEDGNVKINIEKLLIYLKQENILDSNYYIDFNIKPPKGYGTILTEIVKVVERVTWESELGKMMAYKAQIELERAVLHIVSTFIKKENINVCLAGGIFLNSIINNQILELNSVKHIYIQPAATDDGTAIGYAYWGYTKHLNYSNWKKMDNVYLGRNYSREEIENEIKKWEIKYTEKENICQETARYISENKIVCWFQGRSEFGPRALGNRSIFANPGGTEIKDYLNLKVKRRESFRPFAPVILFDQTNKYFDIKDESPYMLLVTNIKSNLFPAITHADGTSRIQTITKSNNNLLYSLLVEVDKYMGIPMVLNTSFNINGEPLVETPYDAIRSFFLCDADILIMNNFVINKEIISNEDIRNIRHKIIVSEPYNLYKNGMIMAKKRIDNLALEYFMELCNTSEYNELGKKELLELHIKLAELFLEQNNLEKSNLYMEKIINGLKLDISLPDVLQLASMIKSRMGDKQEAVELYNISNSILKNDFKDIGGKIINGIIK